MLAFYFHKYEMSLNKCESEPKHKSSEKHIDLGTWSVS